MYQCIFKNTFDNRQPEFQYSRPASFTGLPIPVLLIHGKITVVIFVHQSIGSTLFRSSSCAGVWSNTQQPESSHLSQ
jgi:hypothetical protein